MRTKTALQWAASLLALVVSVSLGPEPTFAFSVKGSGGPQRPQVEAAPARDRAVIIKSQHKRLTFPLDIKRLAVGDADILFAELITSREVLALGRQTGRTTLIVWFVNGTQKEFVVSVERDLSVLERALGLVNPTIRVESAPDRDALVLTGRVPDVSTSQAAEAIARNYLDAGSNRRGGPETLLAAPPATSTQPRQAATTAEAAAAPPAPGTPAAATAPSAPTVQVQSAGQQSGTVINLIELDLLPLLPEEKVQQAIKVIGGGNVRVSRVMHGTVRDDSKDTLVLEGKVPTQVALVRVLALTAQLFVGQTITSQDIRVVADEAGGLAEQGGQGQSQNSQSQSLGGGASSSLFGGNRGARLANQIQTNIGRAKAIEAAGGRILSFIEVTDLPQVRVDIRLVEVNRTKLRAFNPNAVVATSDFRQPSLNPAQSAVAAQGDQAARVGSSGPAIQNVLSFLNGSLLNQIQYAGANFAIDAALSLLERQGIAQSLSSPSLTVLSGEMAQVQVGGEVPVPMAFAPAFGTGGSTGNGGNGTAASTPGVFSSVQFVPFGVQLQIRPLVGDDDTITLDVQPQIVTPDAVLTDAIRQSTGAAVPTTAFQTRALRTSSRLLDGQALVIGGLITNNTSANATRTPWVSRIPIIGRFFEGFNRNDQSTELVIVVNPVVLRTPVADAAMWMFPERSELLRSLIKEPAGTTRDPAGAAKK